MTEETFDGDYIDPMVLDEQPKKEIVSSNRPNFPEAMDTVMNNTTLSNRYTTSQASLDNASSLHPGIVICSILLSSLCGRLG